MAGLLDALRDPQFRRDYLQGLIDAGNRGVAGVVGGPVDLAAMVMRPLGYNVEQPVMGSEWIGQKMQDAGLVSSARNPTAEMLASVVLPGAMVRGGALLDQAVTAGARNLAAPRTLHPQRGVLNVGSGAAKIDDLTGLPLNPDGTVTVYHHTNAAAAEKIKRTGMLKSAGEPDVYVTSYKGNDTGYGDVVVPIRVKPDKLMIDDEFPGGRIDFRMDAGRPGGAVRVLVGEHK